MKIDLTQIDCFVVGISSGKDSTALLLWLLNESGIDRSRIICIFADTQFESPQVYGHIDKISRELHPVITIRADKSFLELANHKGRFPSAKARFCTQELKLKPAKAFMDSLEGRLMSVNGERAEESPSRTKKSEFAGGFETYHGYPEWRPLLDWALEDVFLIHKKYDFPLNPLYALGFERVGCMPCVLARKSEIKLMARHFPERVDEIRQSEIASGSFFHSDKTPPRFRSREFTKSDGETIRILTIDDVIAWSNTEDLRRSRNRKEPAACIGGVCDGR